MRYEQRLDKEEVWSRAFRITRLNNHGVHYSCTQSACGHATIARQVLAKVCQNVQKIILSLLGIEPSTTLQWGRLYTSCVPIYASGRARRGSTSKIVENRVKTGFHKASIFFNETDRAENQMATNPPPFCVEWCKKIRRTLMSCSSF